MSTLLILLLIIAATSVLWLPILVIYLVIKYFRNSKSGSIHVASKPIESAAVNEIRDNLWTDYISSYRAVVTTKKEQLLIDALVSGLSAQEYALPTSAKQIATAVVPLFSSAEILDDSPRQVAKPRQPVDSTLLLLYFGAFLLVASVGLFVAISELDGIIRTLIVAVTAAGLYYGGLQLHDKSQKLAVAGVSFVGSGMVIAPLTGVTYYNLVADKTGGALIWLITSIICVSLYAYALRRLHNDFIAYLLIGSFVSSIESSVLTIGLPTFGYAWGLVAAAIVLALFRRTKTEATALERSSSASATFLVPLSIIGSATLLPNYGSLQLAVTLFLAGGYYALVSRQEPSKAQAYILAAQISVLAGIANLVYAKTQTIVSIGLLLTVVSVVYSVLLENVSASVRKQFSLAEIAITVTVLAVLATITAPWPLIGALLSSLLLAIIIWLLNRNDDALQAAGIVLILLPFVAGQYALSLPLGSYQQLLFCAASAGLLAALTVFSGSAAGWRATYPAAAGLYWCSVAAVLIPAWFLGFASVVAVTAAVLITCVVLRYRAKDASWLIGGSFLIFAPLSFAFLQHGLDSYQFSLAVIAALVWNAAVSLVTRQSVIRWLVVILILLMPLAIGGGGFGFHWSSVGYSLGYLAALAGCLAARTIARGRLLVSFRVPIASYYAEASQAYVVGYIVAGLISLVLSLDTNTSRVLTTVILAVIAGLIVFVARMERQPDILIFLPIILQAGILSAVRPDFDNPLQVGVTAVISVLAAAACYVASIGVLGSGKESPGLLRQVSAFSSYAGPALVITQSAPSRLLPLSLFVSGLVTLHYKYRSSQQNRELGIGVCVTAGQWLLYLYGVTNVLVHVHLIALTLGAFAYWRHVRREAVTSQSYVKALFLVVTIPLILSSLGGNAGGTYGLILIAEQVLFMLIGASLPADTNGQRFLLRWGLWTALAAILFQLRGLGYAFVSLLAVIIIGTAIYRLQKKPLDK